MHTPSARYQFFTNVNLAYKDNYYEKIINIVLLTASRLYFTFEISLFSLQFPK